MEGQMCQCQNQERVAAEQWPTLSAPKTLTTEPAVPCPLKPDPAIADKHVPLYRTDKYIKLLTVCLLIYSRGIKIYQHLQNLSKPTNAKWLTLQLQTQLLYNSAKYTILKINALPVSDTQYIL